MGNTRTCTQQADRRRRVLVIARGALAAALLVALLWPGTVTSAAQGNQGLQGGWAIDDSGNLAFAHSVQNQLPLMVSAGAGWVRINFRLGGCYNDWTSAACYGSTALQRYDILVNDALGRKLKILGVLSPESWPGSQTEWTANNAENTGGNGDNPYLQAFSAKAALVLAEHFQGKVTAWQVWNEPNVWATQTGPTTFTGGTFIYPSNFAWLLAHVYQDTRLAHVSGVTFVSGGVVGHDPGGLATVVDGQPVLLHGDYAPVHRLEGLSLTPPSVSAVPSGADYLTATYTQGKARAGWDALKQAYGSFPLDGIGQHLYIDQFGKTSSAKIAAYLDDLRNAYVAAEGPGTTKKTVVTEVGWSTANVNQSTQQSNLSTAYARFKATSYLLNAYWFSIQDVPEAGLYFGLQTGGNASDGYTGKPKSSFRSYQKAAAF